MATGAFLSARSENEVAAANLARERQEIAEHPEEELEELSLFYQLKGLSKEEARGRAPDRVSGARPARNRGTSQDWLFLIGGRSNFQCGGG